MAAMNCAVPARVAGTDYAVPTDGPASTQAQARRLYTSPTVEDESYSATPKWESSYMCDEMLRHADRYSQVFQIEYRLAQGAPYPPNGAFSAALVDALAGHDY